MRPQVRPFFMAAAFVLLTWSLVAQAQALIHFDIPAQSLADSLRAVGSQASTNILFDPPLVAGRMAPALKADLTVEQALSHLLAGTGIKHEFLNETTVVLAAQVTPPSPAAGLPSPSDGVSAAGSNARKERKNDSSGAFRVAQATAGQSQGDVSVEKGSEEATKKKPTQLEEVIVTGTRLPTNFGQQVLPVRTYTREDIQRSGQTTIANFLNTLPDVSISNPDLLSGGDPRFTYTGQEIGETTVQLHGLPFGITLVLLDGRRVDSDLLGGQFDLSTIPAAAIERVEVLPVGASAIYGSNALGGAINMILRKDFNGFEAKGSFGDAPGRGGDERTASLGWGKSWERASFTLMGSYRESYTLAGGQRKWTSTTTDFPSDADPFFYVTDACAPGNVYSVDGQNLPGLSSSHVAIPAGITGVPTIAELAPGAGKTNLCNSSRYVPSATTQDESVAATAHLDLSSSAEIFAQVMFSHWQLRIPATQATFFSSSATLGATSAYNPFGEDVLVSYFATTPILEKTASNLLRPLIGIRGNLGSAWHYEASALLVRDGYVDNGATIDFDAFQTTTLTSPDPNVAFNPFATAPAIPSAAQTLGIRHHDDQLIEEQALIRGPVWQLPAGPIEVVFGGEHSETKQSALSFPELRRDGYAAFTEARVPLLAGPPQGGGRLALTAAGRYDHAADYGSKATWQAGLAWHVIPSLTLVGSYGTSYKAPTPFQLAQPATISFGNPGASDPFRGNEPVPSPVKIIFGPNATLDAETGASRTLSLNYSSQAVPGLAASLSHFAIDIDNYIAPHTFQDLVSNPDLFPGAVVRQAPSPTDPPGFLGKIIQINQVNYNYGKLHINGFDADVSYAFGTRVGKFTPSLAVSNVYRWQAALTPNSPSTNNVNTPDNSPGWSPRWKGSATLAWSRGPVSASMAGRYIGQYRDYQYLVPNSNMLGNSWRYDFDSSFDLGHAFFSGNQWLAGTTVSVGASNVFNQMPPFSYGLTPYDNSQYDVRGRFIHAEFGLRR